MLLGRITYEVFAAAWPGREETAGELGKLMNSIHKVVVSTTLTEATWRNTTIMSGDDVPGQVAKLKEQYDGDVLVYGSVALVDTLRRSGLVDEYRLMIHPVLLGEGKCLFAGSVPSDLELAGTPYAGPDVIVLTYRPAVAAAG